MSTSIAAVALPPQPPLSSTASSLSPSPSPSPSPSSAPPQKFKAYKLFAPPSVLEPRDELDGQHERCFQLVTSLTADKGEKEAHEALAAAASKDPKTHEDICVGLLVGCLGDVDPGQKEKHYRDLQLVSRDGLAFACSHLTHLVLEKFPRMVSHAKTQLLWLTNVMIKSSVNSIENICWNLMRQIAGGNVTQANLWLADHLLDIFIENRSWLEKFSFLLASVVYTYLRVIEDHYHVPQLREKEVRFVVSIMRDRFSDVIVIGRDLVRVLQQVAKIPQFAALWTDIQMSPKNLSPTFAGITQLMRTRTSRRFLQSRITPEMEKKLVFLTSQVRFGTHKRYQDWFQRQYLATTESQSLRCDLIRFIVGVIHPTNELLGSDIIPRWAVIGWLLTTCTNQVASSNAKLALFYDWLYFTPEKDNIMNIEPAILVMHHSMKPHPAITATLLDFLCRIITNFYPRESEKVRQGIYASLSTIVEKRVLPSLVPLFDNPRLDNELRKMLRERFGPLIFGTKEGEAGAHGILSIGEDLAPPVLRREDDDGPRFSDDDDEDTLGGGGGGGGGSANDNEDDDETLADSRRKRAGNKKKGKKSSPSSTNTAATAAASSSANSSTDATGELDDELKEILLELKSETDLARRCEVMDKIVRAASSEEKDLEFEQCSALASRLDDALSDEFEGKLYPSDDPSPENVEDSIGRPLFVIFRSLCEMSDHASRQPLLMTLAELYTLQPRIGYYLLYFLIADRCSSPQSERRTAKEKAAVYKELCEYIDAKYSLDICLVNDMRQCQEDDVNMFVYLAPEIFANFPKHSVGNVDLLYLVVSCVDGRQVQRLVCHIVARDFVMFKKDSFKEVLSTSLSWETFEQYALWHLAAAHDLPIECVISLVPKLSYLKHAEALTSVLLMLRQERPTPEIVKNLFARDVEPGDTFVTSALTSWLSDYGDQLADLISSLLVKLATSAQSSTTSAKRKRGGQSGGVNGGSLSHPAELCLGHLDAFRQKVVNQPKHAEFFNQEGIQSALQTARQTCADVQKTKFSDLFALADSDSDSEELSPPPQKSTSSSSLSNKKKSSASNSSTKSPGKSKKVSAAAVASSDGSSDDSEKEVAISSKKQRGGSGSGSRGGSKNPSRKRAKNVSYKISSEESSDDDELIKRAPKKKAKKSASAANSDSD